MAEPSSTAVTGNSAYVPLGNYNDACLTEADKKIMENYKYQWDQAMKAGDVEAANKAHEYAERLRAKYHYSGGVDGSTYIPLDQVTADIPDPPFQQPVQTPAQPNTPGGYYTPPALPSANSAEKYIKDIYAAQREATLKAYETAYDANMNELNAAALKIPAQYQAARNQAAAQSEIQRANFNEYAAASGLSSGAGGQAMLAMSNQLQGSLSGIGAAEADALSDLELQRTQLATQYQNDIAQAINTGNLEEAYALYGEYVRVDDSLLSTALAQAGLNADAFGMNNSIYNMKKSDALALAQYTGDYSGMAIYGWTPQQIAAANQQWVDDKIADSDFLD